MTLAADYRDKKGCPHCGAPLRRIGRWYVDEGEWRFKATPISSRRVIEGDRPNYSPEKYTPHETERIHSDPKTGIQKRLRVTEWHWLVEFECMGTLYGQKAREYECPLVQEADAVPYRGPVFAEWMSPPLPPTHDPNAERRISADFKKAAAGDAE